MKHEPVITGRCLGFRQFQVLQMVRAAIEADGQAPSFGMIRDELGIEKGNVSRIVSDLERRGLLSRVGKGKVRRIRLCF